MSKSKNKKSETTLILDALSKCIFAEDPFASVTSEGAVAVDNQKVMASAAVLIHHRMRALEAAVDRLTAAIVGGPESLVTNLIAGHLDIADQIREIAREIYDKSGVSKRG